MNEKLLWKRFQSFSRGTGKTYCIQEQAKKMNAEGKKVLIVCNCFPIYQHREEYKILPNVLKGLKPIKDGKIDVCKLSTLSDILEANPYGENENNSSNWWSTYSYFSEYDFVYVDSDCYEVIIENLLNKIDKLQQEKEELIKGLHEFDKFLRNWVRR